MAVSAAYSGKANGIVKTSRASSDAGRPLFPSRLPPAHQAESSLRQRMPLQKSLAKYLSFIQPAAPTEFFRGSDGLKSCTTQL